MTSKKGTLTVLFLFIGLAVAGAAYWPFNDTAPIAVQSEPLASAHSSVEETPRPTTETLTESTPDAPIVATVSEAKANFTEQSHSEKLPTRKKIIRIKPVRTQSQNNNALEFKLTDQNNYIVAQNSEPRAEPTPIEHPVTEFTAEKKELQYGDFGFNFGFDYSRIDSVDISSGAKTIFITDLSPLILFSWAFRWTESISSIVKMGATFERVGDDTSVPARQIANQAGIRKNLEIGSKKHWSSRQISSLSLGMKDQFFAHAKTLTELQIDRIPTSFLRVEHQWTAFEVGRGSGFVSAAADYLAAASDNTHQTKSGTAYEIGVGLKNQFSQFSIETKINYRNSQQNSQIVEHKEKSIQGTVGITWRFDP